MNSNQAMRKPHCNNVTRLADVRARRLAPVQAPEPHPFAVLERMVETYFQAIQMQMDEVRPLLRKKS
jgi:hypothetical protein